MKGMRGNASSAGGAVGFTLVEVMVVVTIISVLAMLAVPALKRAQVEAQTAVVVSDFRTFAAAFQTYAQETGEWPPEAGQGVVPTGMAGRLNETAWTRTTPLGGKYNWEQNQRHRGVRYAAAISIKATRSAPLPFNVNQLREIDRTIDDGNLSTGRFIRGAGNVPLFIIQP